MQRDPAPAGSIRPDEIIAIANVPVGSNPSAHPSSPAGSGAPAHPSPPAGSGRLLGTCTALASALAFAAMNLLVLRTAGHLGAAASLASRGVVGSVMLAPVVWRQIPNVFTRDGWALWLQCIFGALAALALFYNVNASSVGEAVALSYMAPIIVALVAPLVFGERLGLQRAIGVFIMVAGAACLQMMHSPWRFTWATFIGLCGAMCGGMSLLALKRAAQQHSPWLAAWAFCLFSIITAAAVGSPDTLRDVQALWPSALAIGVFGTLGQILLSWSFRRLPAALAGALSLCTLIFSVLFESIYTAAWPKNLQLAGYALMCTGLLLLQGLTRPRSANPPSA